jgi:hypothetical protein
VRVIDIVAWITLVVNIILIAWNVRQIRRWHRRGKELVDKWAEVNAFLAEQKRDAAHWKARQEWRDN